MRGRTQIEAAADGWGIKFDLLFLIKVEGDATLQLQYETGTWNHRIYCDLLIITQQITMIKII